MIQHSTMQLKPGPRVKHIQHIIATLKPIPKPLYTQFVAAPDDQQFPGYENVVGLIFPTIEEMIFTIMTLLVYYNQLSQPGYGQDLQILLPPSSKITKHTLTKHLPKPSHDLIKMGPGPPRPPHHNLVQLWNGPIPEAHLCPPSGWDRPPSPTRLNHHPAMTTLMHPDFQWKDRTRTCTPFRPLL